MPAVIAGMEQQGIKVDREKLADLSTGFAHQIVELEGVIHGLAGGPFTIGSPKQLGDVLFERMGLKGGRKGKSGVYSTDVTELTRLAQDKASPGAEMVGKVLEWRELTKLKNTYTDALQEQINPETGRVHTSYSLTGAQTGRLSSTDPNLQNIPIRTETGRQLRDAFVAEAGHVILAADYSQIELRLAAHMADVPQLREAFERGHDIHSMTAEELFGEVTRDTRASAKTINFAILYGISRWGLAGRLEISADEAQAMIDRYFDRFPGINRYMAETLTQVREHGFTTTLFGRKTHFSRIKSKVQQRAPGRRTRRDQRADPGYFRRYHQAGDGADEPGAARRRADGHANAAAGPRRTRVRGAACRGRSRARGDPARHGHGSRTGGDAVGTPGSRGRRRTELGRGALTFLSLLLATVALATSSSSSVHPRATASPKTSADANEALATLHEALAAMRSGRLRPHCIPSWIADHGSSTRFDTCEAALARLHHLNRLRLEMAGTGWCSPARCRNAFISYRLNKHAHYNILILLEPTVQERRFVSLGVAEGADNSD